MPPLDFTVPENKRVRMMIDTDCKNEADDQYALAHHLMTPMLDVRGIIAAHFETRNADFGEHQTVRASYDEVNLMLRLMGLTGKYPVCLGADRPMPDEKTPIISDGARMIIEEAMREDDRPLYVAFLGTITDLASALLLEPRIAGRLTAIWIGGNPYPQGGWEFNLFQDRHAANVVFASGVALWQVPQNVYKTITVSLAELQYRVAPCGEVGDYLFRQLVAFNDFAAGWPNWPRGETWCLGDTPSVGVLLQDPENITWTMQPAPHVEADYHYTFPGCTHQIRVYDSVDVRLMLEDFYAKLALHYPPAWQK